MAATITDKEGNVIDHLTQWDTNVSIYIHGLTVDTPPVIHFSSPTSTKSYSVGSTLNENIIETVVPNILLEQPDPISVHIYTYDNDTKQGRTIEVATLPVHPKKRPDDYMYVENITVVNILALNNQVKKMLTMIPTGCRKNGDVLEFTTDIGGKTVVLFTTSLI